VVIDAIAAASDAAVVDGTAEAPLGEGCRGGSAVVVVAVAVSTLAAHVVDDDVAPSDSLLWLDSIVTLLR